MREHTESGAPVKVVLHSDWTAQQTDEASIYTTFGSDEYAFWYGTILVPKGVNVFLDLNGCVIDRARTNRNTYGSVIRIDNNAKVELIDSAPNKKHLKDDGSGEDN